MSINRRLVGLSIVTGCVALAIYFVLSKPPRDSSSKLTAFSNDSLRSSEGRNSNEDKLIPYPKGRWRISKEKLENVVLRISHILISYKDADTSFILPFWGQWDPSTFASRSRKDALNLAIQIYEKLSHSSKSFESIARKYSDDLSTREYGGSLGNVSASHLSGLILDALAVMKPGEISSVIESSGGFHIIKRRTVQSSTKVAAQRIVISYESELPILILPERYDKRSRSEAEKIAREVADKARKEPSTFDDLVEKYSDHEDKRRRGDVGVLESDRPGRYGREIEILSSLQSGEISDPIDSTDGFQIFRRTEDLERAAFGAKYVTLYFDRPELNIDANQKKEDAKKIANRITHSLIAKPETFDRYWDRYRGTEKGRWLRGCDEVLLDLGVEGLAVGQISPKPLETVEGFSIFKRIEPTEEIEKAPVAYELPDPDRPDYDFLTTHVDGENQARALRIVRDKTAPLLSLSQEKLSKYNDAIDRFADFIEKEDTWNDGIRISARNRFIEEIKSIVGPTEYQLFDSAVDSIISEMLMSDGES